MTKCKMRFNNSNISKLETTGREYRVWDEVTANLNVRVTAKGSKSFYLFFRNNTGRSRWLKLGKPPSLTVDQARQRANAAQVEINRGNDPMAERQDRLSLPTMGDLWEEYLVQHAIPKKKPRSVEEDRRLWRLHIQPRLKHRRVDDVGVADVRAMHADMRSTPGAANRTRALLSKMFSFAIENDWRPSNPCQRVSRYAEFPKERFLTTGEVVSLWSVLDAETDQCAATIFRILLLTGARSSEVKKMCWRDLDLDLSAPKWTLRAGEQKGEKLFRKDHVLPLDPKVGQLIRNWRDESDVVSLEWVFESNRKPGTPRQCIKKAWSRIRHAAGIPDVRPHDLRHSYASIAINAGIPLEAIGSTLGHKDIRTTLRYAHLKDETLRAAVGAVSATILG